jgi:hypothetical protein
MKRPKCEVAECNRDAHNGGNRPDGTIYWRKSKGADGGYICGHHHAKYQAQQKGMTSTQWTNSFHAYLKFRKNYCENTDSRLGFECTSTIIWDGMLSVDHIDENHENNDTRNHQTFCHNCHGYKTNLVRKLFSNKKRDETVWKVLKNMLRLSGKDTANRTILDRWGGKYT